MKDVMGIIYTGEKDSFLRELTLQRAIAAVPVAGRYRVIDFFVSAMVNSGVRNVGVIMQKNYHSLMDHLGSGKEWDLHGKNDGLYILPPFLTRENVGVYNGSLDALHSNMNYLRRSRQDYVLFCNSLMVFNPNFNEMFHQLDDSCDAVLMYSKDPSLRRPEYGTYLDVDENGVVFDNFFVYGSKITASEDASVVTDAITLKQGGDSDKDDDKETGDLSVLAYAAAAAASCGALIFRRKK